jgi:hypothetical protein
MYSYSPSTESIHNEKFQYGGHALHHNDESNEEYCASLYLGLTDYRSA